MLEKPVEIQLIRKSLGMTQSQFAQYFHINVDTLRMWEQGVNRTSESALYMVKRILELEGRPYVAACEQMTEGAAQNA